MREIIIVSKEYGKPDIHHRVVHEDGEIIVEMPLDEFLQQLAQQMGPTLCLNRNQMQKKVALGAQQVVEAMKRSTRFAPPPLPRTG